MNFAVLSPELNSGRLFAGAGQGPLLAAAAAWDGLAEEFDSAAGSFAAVSSELTAQAWQGSAAMAMTRVAASYETWLGTAAAQAAQASTQARLATRAYETALAAIVHPTIVAANRTRLVSLAVSDLLGQNAPAIAAVEAEYEQMWAQDVAAMAGYHAGASAASAQLASWQELLENLPAELNNAYAASGLPQNIGYGNEGYGNIGFGNYGNGNIGVGNIGNSNVGLGNTGNGLIGWGLPGDGNVGTLLINEGQVGVGTPVETALIMSGTGFNPVPRPGIVGSAELFLDLTQPTYVAQFLVTPEKFFPFTGPTSLTLDASIAQGVTNLNTAIMAQQAAGSHAVVFGVSQSAVVATVEMRNLEALPANLRPSVNELSFVLIANPDRPDGGLLARLAGYGIPGLSGYGATPSNAYPTIDYAFEYDGVADFPQYPIDLLADANALAGIFFVHPAYDTLTPTQIASGIVQPVSPGDTETTYILIPNPNLPLLDPLRAIPFVGNPLADLMQPDLKVLVDLGYDRTAYQDVPTPFGLFPNVDPATVAAELQQGAVQGVGDSLADLGL